MLKLTDTELDQVFRAAAPLPPADRDGFLKSVAERLAQTTIGPGAVFQICRDVQKQFLNGNYPDLGSGHWSKYE
jgi:hypothetical protein